MTESKPGKGPHHAKAAVRQGGARTICVEREVTRFQDVAAEIRRFSL